MIRRLLRRLFPAPPPPDYLRNQVARSWEKESRNLTWFGLRDGMSILDLGCGPGHFTERLAAAFPSASITALDSDPRMLQAAQERLGARAAHVSGSADSTSLPAASFDFVIARLLFQHLDDPLAVARECRRVLKPGGRLVIIDVDDDLFGVVEPRVPGLRRLLARYGAAQSKRGGNRRIGRALPRLLRDAGFTNVALEAVAIHSDDAGLDAVFPQLDPIPLQSLVAAGQLSEQEYSELREAHARFVASDPYAVILLFMACGLKSTDT